MSQLWIKHPTNLNGSLVDLLPLEKEHFAQEDLKLEIGCSWITTPYWGTGINLECKLLLMTHAFDVLKARRVQLKTDQNNTRSRKAIEKIGGKFEGILRKDRIKDDGNSRSAAYYSILDDEWDAVRTKILQQLYPL